MFSRGKSTHTPARRTGKISVYFLSPFQASFSLHHLSLITVSAHSFSPVFVFLLSIKYHCPPLLLFATRFLHIIPFPYNLPLSLNFPTAILSVYQILPHFLTHGVCSPTFHTRLVFYILTPASRSPLPTQLPHLLFFFCLSNISLHSGSSSPFPVSTSSRPPCYALALSLSPHSFCLSLFLRPPLCAPLLPSPSTRPGT